MRGFANQFDWLGVAVTIENVRSVVVQAQDRRLHGPLPLTCATKRSLRMKKQPGAIGINGFGLVLNLAAAFGCFARTG